MRKIFKGDDAVLFLSFGSTVRSLPPVGLVEESYCVDPEQLYTTVIRREQRSPYLHYRPSANLCGSSHEERCLNLIQGPGSLKDVCREVDQD